MAERWVSTKQVVDESTEECMEVNPSAEPATIKHEQVSHGEHVQALTSTETRLHPNGVKGEFPVTVSVSRKRCRPVEDEQTKVEKRGCEEGMSWWTCLMLGISQENSRSQVVKKSYNQQGN